MPVLLPLVILILFAVLGYFVICGAISARVMMALHFRFAAKKISFYEAYMTHLLVTVCILAFACISYYIIDNTITPEEFAPYRSFYVIFVAGCYFMLHLLVYAARIKCAPKVILWVTSIKFLADLVILCLVSILVVLLATGMGQMAV